MYGRLNTYCRNCKFCTGKNHISKTKSLYCVRFRHDFSSKNKISEWEQACGKFEKKEIKSYVV
ncbi:MAG: hypothetical protein LKJ25_06020 [Clostridia bacterium]|nr:hypothetical protein [Clostridia bacterium]